MFVAVGWYTADASQFGAQVGMTLVDGDGLLRIIAAGLDGDPLELPAPLPRPFRRARSAAGRWCAGWRGVARTPARSSGDVRPSRPAAGPCRFTRAP
jgi:hypothetical protein